MPELPEIQAHAERLTRDFAGSILERFEPLTFTALKTATPDPACAIGSTLTSVGHRGKFLLLRFGPPEDSAPEDSPPEDSAPEDSAPEDSAAGVDGTTGATVAVTFVVHLMQGGRLVPDKSLARMPRNGLARWRMSGSRSLLLTEAGRERKAGVWVLAGDPTAGGLLDEPAPLAGLGPDADKVSLEDFVVSLISRNQRVHGFLRDQHGVAGLGRMLANEICHRARLSPFAMTSTLTDGDRRSLYEAMRSCIGDALAFERPLDAMSRSAERPGSVHRRKGQACPACGDTIRAVEYNAYELDYCPTCQTGGKVLADNTTSRFLK